MLMQQLRRRKQATYGKTARLASSWSFTGLDSLDDESAAPTMSISRIARSQQPASAQKAEATSSKLKPVKRKAEPRKKDACVSSTESSDVDEPSPVKARSPPRFTKKYARSANSWNFTDLDFLDNELAAPTIPISRIAQSWRPECFHVEEALCGEAFA
ncbi:unnamed protein product [Zymoseptoria tritici ST99CH_1A5]|uniref:Uncharacterized protein n=1 Tax=Zymoseptoria tritici ST99CH_1A5 TaxID=1276529 RepID=A0A1Y6M398_ZYMTR|nr:unnamed protein product [Zymoseptoria tritici ST99CH_1A5]